MKIYVGNLPWSTTDADLERLFSGIGPVTSASVVTDRDTGRSRGFGFVEMANAEQANAAKEAMNGAELDGRTLKVDEAKERKPRGGGGGGGYGGGGRW